ncbi:MAG: alpha-amylase family glycosyl hydrolase [Candidatus Delongbacteria bacterium]
MKTLLILLPAWLATGAFAQVVTLEPAAPLVGQTLTITYDAVAGALPDAPAQVKLHWGLYDPDTGGWSLPPAANWPAGSVSPDGFALQSPLLAQGGGLFQVAVPSVEPMEHIAFVFTDGANWDNNGGANWIVDYMASDVACWWTPLEPETGDVVSVFYNTGPGTLPGGPVLLHWGVNESGAGNWVEPPQAVWPAGTVAVGDGMAVRSPMVDEGGGVWSIQLTAVEEINSLHWVFTNGSAWDSNGGGNWNLFVGEPPVFAQVWHRFRLDPRSSFYTGPAQISTVNLAGTMNGWNSTLTPLSLGADGTWSVERVLQEGAYQYKFVVNGSDWSSDPDNPRMNANDNNNSMLDLAPAPGPRATGWSRPDGLVRREPASLELALGVRAPDGGEELNPAAFTARINGALVAHSWDGDSLRLTVPLTQAGEARVEVGLADMDGDLATARWCAALQPEGWLRLDADRDDDGPGFYGYPTPPGGYADLEAVELREAALGDSLQVRVRLRLLHDYSRVNLLLLPTLAADPSADHLRDELETPDWATAGLFLSLLKPTSPHLNPEQDNRLLTDYNPLIAGAPLSVWTSGQTLVANLPMDLLEERLGSWQEDWFLGCFATITGVAPLEGGVTEVGPGQGGLSEAWDCDVYDAACVEPAGWEDVLLANSSLGRTARLDAAGRGFAPVLPEDVGPHMASPGPVVRFLTQGGSTTLAARTVRGTATPNTAGSVRLVRQAGALADSIEVALVDGIWSTNLTLLDGLNRFQAKAQDADGFWGSSSALEITLLREHAPQPQISLLLQESVLQLYGTATVDIDGDITGWLWEMEEGNPEAVAITNSGSMVASVPQLPATDGAYWFRLTVTDAQGHTGTARGLFEVENGRTRPVGQNDYPLWVRDAIVYEIFVRSFDSRRNLAAVTERLDEIVELGANTIWFMPVFEGPSDHGYAVNDYYAVEQDYGTESDLRTLVEEAHARGLRVVLDMVLNHSSIDHPWMQSALEYGDDSLNRGWYMWNQDGTHQYYYDWSSLPNFNVSHPDYKREAAQLSRYWIEEVGVDGYRCDVAWGPQERDGQFWRDWRRSIRVTRPDLLLLAEAGADDFSIFDGRFNLAYDWPLFWNALQEINNVAPSTVQDRVSNVGFWYPDNALPFRFLENHDEARFYPAHNADQTRCAAALLFSLPGVPLIYAGQEVGETTPRGLINWSDPQNLRPYYQQLCRTRGAWPQFRTNRSLQLVNNDPSQVYSLARVPEDPATDGVILCVYNFSDNTRSAQLTLPVADWGMEAGTWYLTDLFGGGVHEYTGGVDTHVSVDLANWDARWFILGNEAVDVSPPDPAVLPVEFQLGEPWPNPFNPRVSIPLTLPAAAQVELEIFNLAGQRVATLADGWLPAGRRVFHWNAGHLASGTYVVQARAGAWRGSRKLSLVK